MTFDVLLSEMRANKSLCQYNGKHNQYNYYSLIILRCAYVILVRESHEVANENQWSSI